MTPKDFSAFPTGNLCNAHDRVRALAPAIKPLIPNVRISGRAKTARIRPGQNAAIHHAVHTAQPGDILVVDGGGSERFGPFGDLLASACMAKGIVGAVFDCAVRDSTDIRALGFQLFGRGYHPEPTAKTDPGEIDVPVVIGGVLIQPGDVVVGDEDGVVAFDATIADEVAVRVAEVVEREERIRARIAKGETTYEIFNLKAD